MWLETKDVPDHKEYVFILKLLGKEGLQQWDFLYTAAPISNEKEWSDHVWEAFEGSFRQISSFKSYSKQSVINSWSTY